MTRDEIIGNFRNERYHSLNEIRWNHFLSMGIPITGRTIFEPGAGIGDQTEWLLKQGAAHIYINEGRADNMAIIKDRFQDDLRVSFIDGNLERDLWQFDITVDLIFCYGVYYHLYDPPPFDIMRQFSRLGRMIVFDYLVGGDTPVNYGYENPSVSLSQSAFRPRTETLLRGLEEIWGNAYEPKEQLQWTDPVAVEQRLIAVGSHLPLENEQLKQFCSNLVAV